MESLQNFGGGVEHPKPPLGTPLIVPSYSPLPTSHSSVHGNTVNDKYVITFANDKNSELVYIGHICGIQQYGGGWPSPPQVTRYEESKFDFREKQEVLFYSMRSKLALKLSLPPIQQTPLVLSPRVKGSSHEANHSPRNYCLD